MKSPESKAAAMLIREASAAAPRLKIGRSRAKPLRTPGKKGKFKARNTKFELRTLIGGCLASLRHCSEQTYRKQFADFDS
jgi:hypothetical protein